MCTAHGHSAKGHVQLKSSLRLCLLSVWSGVGLDSPAEEVSFSDFLEVELGLAVIMEG